MTLFIGQSYLNNDEAQFYLMFQLIYKTITTFSGLTDTISEWESEGFSYENFTCTFVANLSAFPKLMWMNNSKIRLKFKETT